MNAAGPKKRFGIIGGLGPLAGADIFLKLAKSTPALIGYLVNDCCAEAPAGCLPDCPSVSPAAGAKCPPPQESAHRRMPGRR